MFYIIRFFLICYSFIIVDYFKWFIYLTGLWLNFKHFILNVFVLNYVICFVILFNFKKIFILHVFKNICLYLIWFHLSKCSFYLFIYYCIAIFVAIAKNTLYESKWSIFILCQKS